MQWNIIVRLVGLLSLFILAVPVHAEKVEDAVAKGLSLSKQVEEANQNFVGESSTMEMILVDAHGTRSEREMVGKTKEIISDGDKGIMEFLNPKDVKGTKLLTWAHKLEDDQQWLYLPSLRRVKRISGSNKSSSFMGSEFSFEDLGGQQLEKYEHKWLRDETLDGEKVWVLERTPKTESGYSKMVLWIAQKYMGPLKIQYFDRKGELLKEALFSGYKSYTVGKKTLFRSSTIDMSNVQTLKKSSITWKNRELGKTFADRDFDQSTLK
jgi:outer membrane lipoprotein-sorting protein